MLENFSRLRKELYNTSVDDNCLKGEIFIENNDKVNLITDIPDSKFYEIYEVKNKRSKQLNDIEINDRLSITFNLYDIDGYHEYFEDFLSLNKYKVPDKDFYIHDIKYLSTEEDYNELISKHKYIVSIIDFLDKIAFEENYHVTIKMLTFQNPNQVLSTKIDYGIESLKYVDDSVDIAILKNNVINCSDSETKIKLFNNELVALLNKEGNNFKNILKSWDKIVNNYKNSHSLYAAEFSFEKIKTTSQEHFHDLTDRMYSTIHKFSGYILAVPVAYIFIIRFFDFSGNNLLRDVSLLSVGLIYFLFVWFVLLDNLDKAFTTIESDIKRFENLLSENDEMKEIKNRLKSQKKDFIPDQKNKIIVVRWVSALVLLVTMFAFVYIHFIK